MQPAIQDTYPDEFARCYGCGRLNEHGHRFRTRRDGPGTSTEYHPAEIYTGAADFAYGGLIASLIDCHSAGSAAIFWMEQNHLVIGSDPTPRFVTARLEVDYIAPTPLNTMRVGGTAEEIGDRKVIVTSELTVAGRITARGRAVLVRI
jgi:acyl-coenzyme A thioesterase PaaI-like protein